MFSCFSLLTVAPNTFVQQRQFLLIVADHKANGPSASQGVVAIFSAGACGSHFHIVQLRVTVGSPVLRCNVPVSFTGSTFYHMNSHFCPLLIFHFS